MARLKFTLSALGLCALAACGQQNASLPLPAQPQIEPAHKGPKYATIYNFKNGSDAYRPTTALVAFGGKLYGTSYFGGGSGRGTVFEVSITGKERVIHNFGSGSDGQNPSSALIVAGGFLYGTTNSGGTNGNGVVFKMTAAGKEEWVYSFGGGSDGANPAAPPTFLNGTLYGTTTNGGTDAEGVVYAITTSGSERVLYSFNYSNNATDPYNTLAPLIALNGTLYGTAFFGGNSNIGAVFSATTSGSVNLVYSFLGNGQNDGALPTAALSLKSGVFYGTTSGGGATSGCTQTAASGCGTVFSVTPAGTEHVMHSFGVKGTDGQVPIGGLRLVGTEFYGTTENGGAVGNGTIFKIATSGKERVLYSFRGGEADGANPQAGLIALKGKLYGTTSAGGASGNGTVFELTP